MKKGMLYFWAIFILYFIFAHPAIIHYGSTQFESDLTSANPWFALSILLMSALMWIVVLYSVLKWLIIAPFEKKNAIDKLLKSGIPIVGTIIESVDKLANQNGIKMMDIKVQVTNFVGCTIVEQISINDSKPELNRYDKGNLITLFVDKSLKSRPYFITEGTKTKIKPKMIFLFTLLWLIILCSVIGYYIFSYQYESMGYGWRFLSFGHPLFLSPAIMAFIYLLITGVLRRYFGIGSKGMNELHYYGIRTSAKVTKKYQTGTYINKQPEVGFDICYEDENGATYNNTIKKIIPLINLHNIDDSTMSIFYLKDDPNKITLASDLEK